MKKLRFNKQTEQKFSEKLDEKTLQSYRSWYDQLYKFSDYSPLRTLKFEIISDFFDFLLNEKKYSPSSMRIANAALRFLYLEVFKIKHSFDKIKLPRIEKVIPVSISKVEVKKLLDSIKNIKQRTIITLIYAAGLDTSEVINIRVKDIENEKLSIRNNKGNIVRQTYLGVYTLDLLREYYILYKPKNYLFEGLKKNSHYSTTSIRNIFIKAKESCGIPNEITPRHLKYSYVKHLQDEGYKTADILKHLNLFNGYTIEYYSQIDDEVMEIEYSPIDSLYGKKKPKSIKIEVTNEQAENIVFTDAQTKYLLEKNPDIIKGFLENNLTHSDIVALGYRKKQLVVFQKLINEQGFFELFKKEREIIKNEQVWQLFFESNPWIFGHGLNYIFSSPLDGKKLEQVVAGYDFNSSGKRVDGLLKTKGLVSSLCFVEIKTHKTDLLKTNYYRKESWSASDELSGAISQIQRTVDKSLKSISSKVEMKDNKGNLTGEQVFLYQPKSYLIIGSLSEFLNEHGVNEDKYSSFEMLRRNIFNPEILTFDELYERAKYLVENIKQEV
ncbi:site-specific recombinase XerD [Mariniflexile fucanivorans]|uniref:Site-specific recombinase XerD n=1 Tax=Mariniflexile fucanivorans TaxID=264023 RepID=A0A4R1RGH3_9FLAO|nr:Shedu anti-phage system protein SduA domain-containing protein [Mariniflexile fucanivorans]TCL65046.1 site-specific recombinase XerD [Mariniflexile fucanivorans]